MTLFHRIKEAEIIPVGITIMRPLYRGNRCWCLIVSIRFRGWRYNVEFTYRDYQNSLR